MGIHLGTYKRWLSPRAALAVLMAVVFPVNATQGPTQFSLSGGLYSPTGTPITQKSVDFRVEILDANNNCVLYQELHNDQDLSTTKGGFALQVGTGTDGVNNVAGGSVLTTSVFENNGVTAVAGCGSVNLSSGDNRLIRVSYDLGSGFVAMNPTIPMTSSAYAMVAETVQGKHASDLVQIRNDNSTYYLGQSNIEWIFNSTNWPRLQDLLNGTSSQYMVTSPSADVSFNNRKITNVAAPTANTDAATKQYTDGNIGGFGASLSGIGLGNGEGSTLVWDSVDNRWEIGSPNATDNTKLPLAGGTMSGAVTMGGNDIANVGQLSDVGQIYNVGHITMKNQSLLRLGSYTSTQEGLLALGTGNAGSMFYNSDLNQLRVWDGTDYSAVSPGGAAGGDLTGAYPNPTIADSAVTSAKIADGAVSSGDIADGAIATVDIGNNQITSAKLNNSGIAVNRLLMTDASTGATVAYATCAQDEILKFNSSTGWGCSSAVSLIGDTAVTAGSYGSATSVGTFSVDAQGRLTSASNVAINFPVTSVAGKTGDVSLNTGDVAGLGTAATYNVGTAANEIPALDSSARIPAVDGGLLTNVNAVRLQGRTLSSASPNDGQVLRWNNTSAQWEPTTIVLENIAGAGDITEVNSGNGLLGGVTSGVANLSVNAGTSANQIVQLGSDARIPALDGSLLSNLNADRLQTRVVANTAPTEGQVLRWNNTLAQWEPQAIPSAPVSSVNGKTGVVTIELNDIAGAGDITQVTAGNGLLGGGTSAGVTLSVNSGTGANQIVQIGSDGLLPVIDGSKLTNLNALRIQGQAVSAVTPLSNQVLRYNSTSLQWEAQSIIDAGISALTGDVVASGPGSAAATISNNAINSAKISNTGIAVNRLLITDATTGATVTYANCAQNELLKFNSSTGWGCTPDAGLTAAVTSLSTGTGLLGGPVTSTGTISVDVGTGANQIVQLGADARIPALDGSLLSNLNAIRLQGRTVSSSAPSANQLLVWNGSQWEPQTSAVANAFIQGGNSYSSVATLGTNDNYRLDFETNNTTRMSIDTTGNVGIGTTSPAAKFEVADNTGPTFLRLSSNSIPAFVFNASGNFQINPSNDAAYNSNQGITFGNSGQTGVWGPNGHDMRYGAYFNHVFLYRGTERLRIDGVSGNVGIGGGMTVGGNVGIGTTSPAAKLDVADTSTTTSAVIVPRAPTFTGVAVNGMIRYNTSTQKFEAFEGSWKDMISTAASGADITDVIAGSGLLGGASSGAATLSVQFPMAATADGTAALPTYTFSSDPDTGMYRSGANQLAFAVQGTQRLRFDANGKSNFFADVSTEGGVLYTQDLVLTTAGDFQQQDANATSYFAGRLTVGANTVTTGARLDVVGTGSAFSSMIIPRDTAANRPTVGVNGMIRYNTSTQKFEAFEGSWKDMISTAASGADITDVIAGSGLLGGASSGAATLSVQFPMAATSDGTAADPAYSFSGDTDNGMFKPSTNWLAFSTAGTQRVTVDSSGNVGIGTTAPGTRLEVNGQVKITGGNPAAGRVLTSDSTGLATWQTPAASGETNTVSNIGTAGIGVFKQKTGVNFELKKVNAASTKISIVDDTVNNEVKFDIAEGNLTLGNLGGILPIAKGGTGSSTQNFVDLSTTQTIGGAKTFSSNATFSGNVSGSRFLAGNGDASTPSISFSNNSQAGFYSPSAGVIGVTSDDRIIFRISYPAGIVSAFTGGGVVTYSNGTAAAPTFSFSGDTDTGWWRPTADTMAASTAGSERLRITADGNVGIGTTAPKARLDVNGGIRFGSMTACTAAEEGSQRYNSTLKIMEYCDGVAWQTFGTVSIPTGSVMAFDLASCPYGWTALAGAAGRVIIGVGSNGTNSYTLGQSGGSDSMTLTVAQLPAHTHTVDPPATTTTSDGAHTHTYMDHTTNNTNAQADSGDGRTLNVGATTPTRTTDGAGAHTHSVDIASFNSGSAGSGSAIDKRTAFYSLLYCRKD